MTLLRRPSRSVFTLASVAATTALLAGCADGFTGKPSDEPVATAPTAITDLPSVPGGAGSSGSDSTQTIGACESYDGPLVEADIAGAPTIEVPQPEGWDRMEDMESKMMPLVLANRSLADDDFTPNLVVNSGPTSGSFDDVIDAEVGMIEKQFKVKVDDGERGTICGLDSYTIEYEAAGAEGVPVHPITQRFVMLPGSKLLALTIQAVNPDKGSYREDLETILDGVQIGTSTTQ